MNRKNKNLFLGGLLLAVFVMAVAFAGFTQRLTINDSSSISSNWNVGFSAATPSVACSGTPTSKCGTVSTSIASTTGATKSLTFSTKLFSPGDSVTYTVTVKNFGNVGAKLSSISLTPSNNSNNIKYSQSGLTANSTTIAAGATKQFTVTVTFQQVDGAVAAQTNSLTLYLDWVQS